jgi:hypothetical protein
VLLRRVADPVHARAELLLADPGCREQVVRSDHG